MNVSPQIHPAFNYENPRPLVHILPGNPHVPPRRQTSSNLLALISSPTAPCIVTETPRAFFSSYAIVISTRPDIGARSGHVITIFGRPPVKKSRSVPKRSSASFPVGMKTLTGILRGEKVPVRNHQSTEDPTARTHGPDRTA